MRSTSVPSCFLAFLVVAPSAAAPVPTSIVPNGLGTQVQFLGGRYDITGGTNPGGGGNLFHSFSTFNLGTGDTAAFDVSSSVTNILARVTDGASSIDGTLTATIGPGGPLSHANLFFINPAGVIFTANAHLSLGGSFVVTSANTVQLSDGTVFRGDVSDPVQDAGLTSAPVSAFGFAPGTTQPGISFIGAQLSVATGAGLHVIGGDITLDAAHLLAPSGFLTIFSGAGTGSVPFLMGSPGTGFASATTSGLGTLTMRNGAGVAIDGTGGGAVIIRAGHLVMSNATVSSQDSGAVAGGPISVQTGDGSLTNAAEIIATTSAAGSAGDINVQADSLTLDGTNAPRPPANGMGDFGLTGICSNSLGQATGDAGSVHVTVTNLLSVSNSSLISASTFAAGAAGDVVVQAGALTLSGAAEPTNIFTGIASEAIPGSTGAGGDVQVNVTDELSLLANSEISTTTNASGNAGQVNVQAGSIQIDGSANPADFTGIASSALAFATGDAGPVTVVAGDLSLIDGGEIQSNTAGVGAAGSITVSAASLTIDGQGEVGTGILSNSLADASGKGNNISVSVTDAFTLKNEGEVASNTFGTGAAGDVTLSAGSIVISAPAGSAVGTDIDSEAAGGSRGPAGAVSVTTPGSLSLTGEGAVISTSSFGGGNAGSITVQAGTLTMDDSVSPNAALATGVLSAADGALDSPARAGSVAVTVTGALTMTGGTEIDSSSTTSGNAGEVSVKAGSLTVDGIASNNLDEIVSEATGVGSRANSGKVTVNVGGQLTLANSGDIDTDTSSLGNAGDVTVTAGTLTIDGTLSNSFTGISSDSLSTAAGNGGNVTVAVDGRLHLLGGGEIVTDSFDPGAAGDITVTAHDILLEGDSAITSENGGPLSGTAPSGDISVTATKSIAIETGSVIDTDSYNCGKAGNVTVTAATLTVSGSGDVDDTTDISSDAVESSQTTADGSPAGGLVTVNVTGALKILNSGEIDATTYDAAQGGEIIIRAGSITINAQDSQGYETGIVAEASDLGDAGKIDIVATHGPVLVLNGGTIATDSDHSKAGDISITAPDLKLMGNAYLDTAAAVDGGSLYLQISGMLYMSNSTIETMAKGGDGTMGGSMTVDPRWVILNNSLVSANDSGGTGGNILLQSDEFLNSNTQITATGSRDGVVTITAPTLDLSGSLLPLPNGLVTAESRLRETCARAIDHETSSFVVVGRGGTESGPQELQADFGPDQDTSAASGEDPAR